MRKLFLVPALLLSMLVGGCTVGKIPDDVNDPTFPVLVDRSKDEAKTIAYFTTSGVLLVIDNPVERGRLGNYTYQVAEKVNKAAVDQTLDLEGLKAYAQKLVDEGDSKEREIAGFLLNAVVMNIEDELRESYYNIKDDRRVVIVRALIVGASEGVMQATRSHRTIQKVSTQPVTRPT